MRGSFAWVLQEQVGLLGPVGHGERRGHPERVEGVDVAARGQDLGAPDQVAARDRWDKVAAQRVKKGPGLVACGQKRTGS